MLPNNGIAQIFAKDYPATTQTGQSPKVLELPAIMFDYPRTQAR